MWEKFPGYPDGVMGQRWRKISESNRAVWNSDVSDYGIDPTQVGFFQKDLSCRSGTNKKLLQQDTVFDFKQELLLNGWVIESEARLNGKEFQACAVCDGFFF